MTNPTRLRQMTGRRLPACSMVLAVSLAGCGSPASEEDWNLDTGSAAGADPGRGSIPADLQARVDQLASANASDATQAWLDIGARYTSAGAFLADLKPALYDPRPVHFGMTRETFSGGGSTFVYFTVDTGQAKGIPAYVHTVGQSLCYHLWQYEDVSHSGFHGTFRKWWAGYAPAHQLPGIR